MESISYKEELQTDLSALRERIGTVAAHQLWCCRVEVTFNSSSYSYSYYFLERSFGRCLRLYIRSPPDRIQQK